MKLIFIYSLILLFLGLQSCLSVVDDDLEESMPLGIYLSPETLFLEPIESKLYDSLSLEVDTISCVSYFLYDDNYSISFNGSSYLFEKDSTNYSFQFLITDLLSTPYSVGEFGFDATITSETDTVLTTVPLWVEKFDSYFSNFSSTLDTVYLDESSNHFYLSDSSDVSEISISMQMFLDGDHSISINGITKAMIKNEENYYSAKFRFNEILPKDNYVGTHNLTAQISLEGVLEGSEEFLLTVKSLLNDPYYQYSWHLDYTSANFFEDEQIDTAAHINIESAWEISRGEGVIVAIIDSVFNQTHEDLSENVLSTYNAATDNNIIPYDGSAYTHGTTCAGVVGSPQNGIGTIGVAPKSKLLLISYGLGDHQTVMAFNYAQKNGAKVISCSWGSYGVSEGVADKIEELYNDGITVVFSNGNDRMSLDKNFINDESELPTVIGVGATGEDNDAASYTNYGSNSDLVAPGGDYSPGLLGLDDMGETGYGSNDGILNENYDFVNGTSFSAPVVAGVVACMLGANPNLSPKIIREILIVTADKVGESASYDSNGFDKYHSYGKINAGKAVEMAKNY
jgi:subtilisin family serine protease